MKNLGQPQIAEREGEKGADRVMAALRFTAEGCKGHLSETTNADKLQIKIAADIAAVSVPAA